MGVFHTCIHIHMYQRRHFDRTRLFYEAMGFRALEVFPTLWDEWNPCLVMVMKL